MLVAVLLFLIALRSVWRASSVGRWRITRCNSWYVICCQEAGSQNFTSDLSSRLHDQDELDIDGHIDGFITLLRRWWHSSQFIAPNHCDC